MFRTALALLLLATVAAADDSPLVALAKRSKRTASKTPVITNETLEASKGRISYAADASSTPSTSAPVPAAAKSTAVPADSQPRKQAPAAGPAATAATEYSLPSTARNIEPQSTVTLTTPQSTVHNVDPQSTARAADPQSTARNVDPQSTARNIEPAAVNPKP
jgi:hypothetical protein